MSIGKIEKIIVVLAFVSLWVILAAYAGGPIFSDEFLYINAGLMNKAELNYGNRFFHVYLQKLFIELAPTPLIGVRIFWGFLVALTAALVYFNARTLLKHSHVFHGLVAVAIFLSFSFIVEYSGEPAVDITVMAMTIIYATVFLHGMRVPDRRKTVLMALGALAFLCFKTKEITIFNNVLLLGFAFDEQGRWSWKNIAEMVRPLLTGFLAAVGLFILLDGVILGDPFFAINPATFSSVLDNYTIEFDFFIDPVNWYRMYYFDEILLAFLLFVMSGIALRDQLSLDLRLLWLFPLVLAVFITMNMLKVTFGYIERFFFPALPFVAFLAPQFMQFELPTTRRSRLGFAFLLLVAGALLLFLRSMMMGYSEWRNFPFPNFLDSIFYPVLLTILFACLIFIRRYNWASVVIPLFCIMGMLFNPLTNNHKYFFLYPKVQERYDEFFYPFEAFKDQLMITGEDVLLVSASLMPETDMLRKDPNEIVGMYNFYFDRRIDKSNVIIGYEREVLATQLIRRGVSQAFISWQDWEWMAEAGQQAELAEVFEIIPDPKENFYFLTRK